jgi:hypothetical protein
LDPGGANRGAARLFSSYFTFFARKLVIAAPISS